MGNQEEKGKEIVEGEVVVKKKKWNKSRYSLKRKNKIFMEEFYPHQKALYYQALKLTKDTDEANDLVQDNFANTFEKMHQYTAGTNAKAFLFRAMYNHFVNLTKKRPKFTEIAFIPASKQLNPERGLNGLSDEYLELLSVLDEREKIPFLMAYVEGYQYEEIAELLDIPDGTIRTQIHRAKEKLNDYITNKTDKEDGSIL